MRVPRERSMRIGVEVGDQGACHHLDMEVEVMAMVDPGHLTGTEMTIEMITGEEVEIEEDILLLGVEAEMMATEVILVTEEVT